jgi:phosphate transport system substrate-binding protein
VTPRAIARAMGVGLLAMTGACGERAAPRPASAAGPGARTTDSTGAPATITVDLTGAGATFPYPLYARWFNSYAARVGTRINYLAVGSGEGIRQLAAGAADFGATDVPLHAAPEGAGALSSRVLQLPIALGAVAITYHLPPRPRPLRLSGELLAGIFLGRITRWNDPRLAALNPGAPLPNLPIQVVHRDDASGTTYILGDYLTAVSPAWARQVGRGAVVSWPAGRGSAGNEGVAATVKQTEGAIGYVEVVYARQNRLPAAHLRNRAGRFVSPMPFEIGSAATTAVARAGTAGWMEGSLVDAPGPSSYPMVSFTWLLADVGALGPLKARQLRDFVQWALTDGAEVAAPLGYAPLPSVLADAVQARIDQALGIPRPAATP